MEKTITVHDPKKLFFRASGATIAMLFLIIIASVEFGRAALDTVFMTDLAYAEEHLKMEKAVAEHENKIEVEVGKIQQEQAETKKILEAHIADFHQLSKNINLNSAVDLYNSAEQTLYLHKLDESRNGETPRSIQRRHELERFRDAALEYRDCVINERKNCEALRPR